MLAGRGASPIGYRPDRAETRDRRARSCSSAVPIGVLAVAPRPASQLLRLRRHTSSLDGDVTESRTRPRHSRRPRPRSCECALAPTAPNTRRQPGRESPRGSSSPLIRTEINSDSQRGSSTDGGFSWPARRRIWRRVYGSYAAEMPDSRSRRISCRKACIWFQLGMPGDATMFAHTIPVNRRPKLIGAVNA